MRRTPLKHNLAFLRRELNLTQRQLADALGCSTSAIQRIELRKMRISPEMSQAICRRFGVTPAFLDGVPEGKSLPARVEAVLELAGGAGLFDYANRLWNAILNIESCLKADLEARAESGRSFRVPSSKTGRRRPARAKSAGSGPR